MVVFDMDNTLLEKRFIDTCAYEFNFTQALELLRQIDKDPVSITYRIASLLKGKHRSDLLNVVQSIPIVKDIYEVVTELKSRNYKIGIISDSYSLITAFVGDKIKADFGLANELVFDGDTVTGQVLIPSYFHYSQESTCTHQVCKTNALRYICNKYSTAVSNCIVIGDSENDVCMVSHAGLGVAFCTTNELLKATAAKHIHEKAFSGILVYAT